MQRGRETSVTSTSLHTTPTAHPRLQPLVDRHTYVRRSGQTWYARTLCHIPALLSFGIKAIKGLLEYVASI